MVSATSTVTSSGDASSATTRTSQLNADASQDRFLKLLVAQLSNQDPLNPMDNAQMTTQMAQISTVSSIEKVNTTLGELAVQLASMQMMQGSTLVGHDVLVEGSRLSVADGSASGAIELPLSADSVKIDILSPGGQIIDTIDLGKKDGGRHEFTWDGSSHPGVLAPSFRVTATNAGKAMTTTNYIRDRVQSVSNEDGVLNLQLRGQGNVPYSAVKVLL
jgi:flagellar basal-body rod modification protein FlgD